MSARVYIDNLRGISLFSGLSRKQLALVAAEGTPVHVAAGTVVMEQGAHGHSALVLLKGSMIVRRNGRKVHVLGPGEMVGEMALLDDGPRSATVVADGECDVLEITRPAFVTVLDEVPEITRTLLATLAGRVRDLDRAVIG